MKYEVLTAFIDLENGDKTISEGVTLELTEERYAQMSERAKYHGGIDSFLKPLTEEVETEEKKAKKKESKK